MILRFSGPLYEWRGPAPFYFVDIPEDESAAISEVRQSLTYGWGVIPVTVKLGKTEWTTSLFPRNGLYAVPVKDAIRKAESVTVGDVLDLELRLQV